MKHRTEDLPMSPSIVHALRSAAALALAGAATACAPVTPVFDNQFGQSVRSLSAQQVRNPDAPTANAGRPVDGIDARAGREAVERYYRSFNDPPRVANPFVIGVSGQSGNEGGER
jgi:hypothetical protein